MRGLDDRPEGFFSYVRLEERIPSDHPLRPIKALADQALLSLNKRFEGLYSSTGSSIDPTGDVAAGDVAAGFLLRTLRADADGANQLQSVVPLVCRPANRCGGLACHRVHA